MSEVATSVVDQLKVRLRGIHLRTSQSRRDGMRFTIQLVRDAGDAFNVACKRRHCPALGCHPIL